MPCSLRLASTCLALLLGCVATSHAVNGAEGPGALVAAPLVIDAGKPVQDAMATVDLDAGLAETASEQDAELSGGEEPGEEPTEIIGEGPLDAGWSFTHDLSDEALAEAWKSAPQSLGSISMGFVEQGRLINGVPFPIDESAWAVVDPEATYGTSETIQFVTSAIQQVKAWYPHAAPLRVNQISAKEGGYLRPHRTHQNGRDVDLGFYYPGGQTIRVREREKVIDVALNWALVKALVIHGDVQFILVDQRVQKVLYEYAKRAGEDQTWLDSLFHAGRSSIMQHARRHRDHFHVRYYNGRAQELARRVAPLLAERPEENIALHKVRAGDTIGGIAIRYGSSASAIRKASGLSSNLLRIGRVLKVPLRRPCTICPIPPPALIPPRRLPPDRVAQHQGAGAATTWGGARGVNSRSVRGRPQRNGVAACACECT